MTNDELIQAQGKALNELRDVNEIQNRLIRDILELAQSGINKRKYKGTLKAIIDKCLVQ